MIGVGRPKQLLHIT